MKKLEANAIPLNIVKSITVSQWDKFKINREIFDKLRITIKKVFGDCNDKLYILIEGRQPTNETVDEYYVKCKYKDIYDGCIELDDKSKTYDNYLANEFAKDLVKELYDGYICSNAYYHYTFKDELL